MFQKRTRMEDFSQPSTSFNLQKLPFTLQRGVVEKLKFLDFRGLRASSKHAFSLCESVHSDFIFEANFFKVETNGNHIFISDRSYNFDSICVDQCIFIFRTIFVEIPLSREKQKELLAMFQERKITTESIHFENETTCSAIEVMDLCEALMATKLTCDEEISPTFTDHSYSSKLRNVSLAVCKLNDKQFFSIRPKSIGVRSLNVSAGGIIRLLKEWISGEREIDGLDLSFNYEFDYSLVAEELNLSVIWTPTWHDYSLLNTVLFTETREAMFSNPSSYYCLWRSNRIRDTYVLRMNSTLLSFSKMSVNTALFHVFY